MDYYEILGCAKESSHEEIKRAYHALALQFHPDKRPDGVDPVKFQLIQEAWNVLGQAESKEEYDTTRKQAELDSESVLVYARVKPGELVPREEEEQEQEQEEEKEAGLLGYKCRCGSDYLVRAVDLREKGCSVHVPCQECTFVIVVET